MKVVIGNPEDMIYVNGANYPCEIRELPEDRSKMIDGTFYIVGEYIYEYIGEVKSLKESDFPIGSIVWFRGKFHIHQYPIELESDYEEFHIKNIIPKNLYEKHEKSVESIVEDYLDAFEKGKNVAIDIEEKLKNTGQYYVPVLNVEDDILTRLIKLMILAMKVILSNYKTEDKKDYSIDNLRSALNGTTKNMSISKFLDWCSLLGLEWEFTIFDDPDIEKPLNPLGKRISISNTKDLYVDVGDPEPNVFKEPIKEKDDPMKKLIKVAVYMKHMVLSDYKDKGSTPHLLNNMRSALKRSGKMMIKYFMNWCEILDLTYIFKIRDPKTGIEYTLDKYYRLDDYINQNPNIQKPDEEEIDLSEFDEDEEEDEL